MPGKFSVNANALRMRQSINDSLSQHNLEDWVYRQIAPLDSLQILDLGCGLGKQLFYLAQRVSPSTQLTGIDISPHAVSYVNSRAHSEGLPNVSAECTGLDDCVSRFKGKAFDLIMSTYAIYYSRDMLGLIRLLKTLLAPEGRIFVCGYAAGTNQEIIRLANDLLTDTTRRLPFIEDFIAAAQIQILEGEFRATRIERLSNKIVFHVQPTY